MIYYIGMPPPPPGIRPPFMAGMATNVYAARSQFGPQTVFEKGPEIKRVEREGKIITFLKLLIPFLNF